MSIKLILVSVLKHAVFYVKNQFLKLRSSQLVTLLHILSRFLSICENSTLKIYLHIWNLSKRLAPILSVSTTCVVFLTIQSTFLFHCLFVYLQRKQVHLRSMLESLCQNLHKVLSIRILEFGYKLKILLTSYSVESSVMSYKTWPLRSKTSLQLKQAIMKKTKKLLRPIITSVMSNLRETAVLPYGLSPDNTWQSYPHWQPAAQHPSRHHPRVIFNRGWYIDSSIESM